MDTPPVCYRCAQAADDPTLVRAIPQHKGLYDHTRTLCRACYDAALSLMDEHPEAPFVALRYNNVTRTDPNYDDYVQTLQMEYWRCAVDFQSGIGAKFGTYAMRCLSQVVKTCLTISNTHGFKGLYLDIRNHGERINRPASVNIHDGEGSVIGEYATIADETAEAAIDKEIAEEIHRTIARMPSEQAFVLHSRYLKPEPLTYKEIGEQMNINRCQVKRIEDCAKEYMRLAMMRFCPLLAEA